MPTKPMEWVLKQILQDSRALLLFAPQTTGIGVERAVLEHGQSLPSGPGRLGPSQSMRRKLHDTYFLQLDHFVHCDRNAQPNLKKFVLEEQRRMQEKLRHPDETIEEYVQRLLRGSFNGKANQAGGRK